MVDTLSLDNDFWRFSNAAYSVTGVEQCCLAWQDRWGANVNAVLYLLWLGRSACVLDETAIREALKGVRKWQLDVVQPLREVRRTVSREQAGSDFYRALKAVELEAEQYEQARWYRQAVATVNAAQMTEWELPLADRDALTLAIAAMHLNLGRYAAILNCQGQAAELIQQSLGACLEWECSRAAGLSGCRLEDIL